MESTFDLMSEESKIDLLNKANLKQTEEENPIKYLIIEEND